MTDTDSPRADFIKACFWHGWRKHDWHDYEGVKFLLEHGADPNLKRPRGWRAIHHAIARDNALPIIDLLLEHGADPTLVDDGQSAVAMAARRGRGDVLEWFERRGIPTKLHGVASRRSFTA